MVMETILRFVTWGGVVLLALSFLAGGIAFWISPNPRFSNIGNAVTADLMITLGATFLLLALATIFPNLRLVRWLADETFKKLCIIGFVLALGMLVLIMLANP